MDDLEALMRRGQAAGYTHLLLSDSKFARLADMDQRYFDNVARVKTLSAQYHIEIVPALFSVGYSNDLLSRDLNLIEALPVKALPLVVRGGVAHLDDPVAPQLPLDFSDWKKWGFHDPTVVAEHGVARVTDPRGANARISIKLQVQPWRQYHVSVSACTGSGARTAT